MKARVRLRLTRLANSRLHPTVAALRRVSRRVVSQIDGQRVFTPAHPGAGVGPKGSGIRLG